MPWPLMFRELIRMLRRFWRGDYEGEDHKMARESEAVRQSIRRLQAYQQSHRAAVAAIQQNPDLSDVGKRKALDQLIAQTEASVRADAKTSWKDATKAKDALTGDLTKAHQAHQSGYDYPKIGVMAQQLKMRYSQPDNPFAGTSRAQRFQADYQNALTMGDVDQARALRFPSAPNSSRMPIRSRGPKAPKRARSINGSSQTNRTTWRPSCLRCSRISQTWSG